MKKLLLLLVITLGLQHFASAFAVTFRVDMSNVTGFTVANVNGTFNNWCGACAPMTDANGDNIWELTINLNAGNYQYKFTYNGWTGQENLTPGSSCTVTQSGFTNRTLAVTGNVVLPVVCYGACTTCDQVLPSYPVTFRVDMNQQTGFTTPEVNGTFNNWCGSCASMTDANGDGIWEKTITLTQGNYEYKFSADNWATQENLTPGSGCTITTGAYTNRTLNVTGPVTLDAVCWGSCVACNQILPSYNITFRVDMSQQAGFTTPEVNGTFNNWCGATCNPLTDGNGDNIWETTIALQTGSYEYKFAVDNWASSEQLTAGSSCTVTNGNFVNRALSVTGDATLDIVCYGSCSACIQAISGCTDVNAANYNPNATQDDGSCLYPGCTDPSASNYNSNANQNDGSCIFPGCTNSNAANYNSQANQDNGTCIFNTTFHVDMTCAGVTFTNVYVTGPWCGWCGAESYNLLSDADGNGVYSGSVQLPAGNIEYKYMVDNWASQENLVDDMQNGGTCAPITDYANFANRSGIIGNTFNDTYGSCVSCGTPIVGCTDPNAVNYDSFANTDNGSCLYQTTFNVDMTCAGVAFTNVYVTGPWCGWCGAEVYNLLTDADGNGIYSGNVQLPAGNIEYKYMLDNWASQENLIDDMQNGASCAPITDYTNYANRSAVSGTTLNDTYGKCGACEILPQTFDVTFQVDMQNVSGFTVPEVNGNFNGWCGGCAPMTDANGDNIWEITIPLQPGNYEYKFAYDSWAGQETLLEGSSCTVTNFGFTNRSLAVNSDVILPVVCWSSCTNCASSVLPVNVTFQVDMSQYTGTFTTPEVNGTFNGWCGNCNAMTDANGDNIWETTVSLLPGTYEYKFSHDAWTGQEELTPGSSCTVTNGVYTNRILNLQNNTVLNPVCWASCSACEVANENNFYFYSSGKCENWAISVNMYVNGILTGNVIFDNGLETDTVETNSGIPLGGYLNTQGNTAFTLEITAVDLFGNVQTLYGEVANGTLTSNDFPAVAFPVTSNNPITLDCGSVSEISNAISVFPNPSNGKFSINTTMALPINYSILDLSGRTVAAGNSTQNNFSLDLESIANGIYLFQLQNSVELKSEKITIEK